MANPNVFAQFAQPVKSVLDYQNDYEKADALKNQNALQSLTLQQQQAATAQSLGERNALQRIAAQAGGDRTALISGLRNSGLPGLMTQADSLEKSGADLATSQSVAGKNKAETAKINQGVDFEKRDKALTDIAALDTPDQAIASLNAHHAAGDIDDIKYQSVLSTLAPALRDPSTFPKWQVGMLKAILTPKDNLDVSKPDVKMVNAGGAMVPTQTNAYAPGGISGTVPGIAPIPITQSADSIASNATARRGQDLTNSRAIDAMSKPFEVTGPDGTPVLVQQDKTGSITPVSGFTPKGAGATPKLNEGQGKATTFAARMADAESTIDALEQKGISGTDYRTIAAGNGLTNWAASPEGQQYRQAQENWVTANLRQESGAAIGKDEMDKDVRKFFPAPGDADSVKAQKARARAVAKEGMLVQAGPGAQQVPGILSRAGSGGTPAPAAAGLPPDIAAILAKHGGK